jgi:hypothetical protein
MSIFSTGLSDDERLVVSPRRARHMLDCGNTRLYELLKSELESYLDGRSRKIVVASIHRHIARRLTAEKDATAERPRSRPNQRRTAREPDGEAAEPKLRRPGRPRKGTANGGTP